MSTVTTLVGLYIGALMVALFLEKRVVKRRSSDGFYVPASSPPSSPQGENDSKRANDECYRRGCYTPVQEWAGFGSYWVQHRCGCPRSHHP